MNFWPEVHFGAANERLKNTIKNFNIDYTQTKLPSNDITIKENQITSFSHELNTDYLGPCPFSILNSLTLERAHNDISLELTEFLGDSYRQYIISTLTYFENPTSDKHTLHQLRTEIVKNLNLQKKGNNKNIGKFILSKCYDEKCWVPPGYKDTTQTSQTLISN